MLLPTFLPLLLFPLALASPTDLNQKRALAKRSYVTNLLNRAGFYRAYTSVGGICAGAGCPIPTPEQDMCTERYFNSQQLAFPPDPLNKTEIALAKEKGEKKWTRVDLCQYLTLVDPRCEKLWGENPWGISDKQAENEKAKYGFVGCPATGEQLAKKVQIETKWSEEKVARMLDLVVPGWDDDGVISASGARREVVDEDDGIRMRRRGPVVEGQRPYNIPLDVAIRMLPPAPLQKAMLECYGWTVAKRGDTCPKIARRLKMTVEKFLAMNSVVVGGAKCPHLLGGFAYCTMEKTEAEDKLREKLGFPPLPSDQRSQPSVWVDKKDGTGRSVPSPSRP